MVEVVGTAPTSVMFITKFIYRHSWKTNTGIILKNKNFTSYLKIQNYLTRFFSKIFSDKQ